MSVIIIYLCLICLLRRLNVKSFVRKLSMSSVKFLLRMAFKHFTIITIIIIPILTCTLAKIVVDFQKI